MTYSPPSPFIFALVSAEDGQPYHLTRSTNRLSLCAVRVNIWYHRPPNGKYGEPEGSVCEACRKRAK